MFLYNFLAHAQNIGINATGAIPNSGAMLDIDVSDLGVKKGLLIPRMTAAERQAITLSQAAQGLLVYQTDGVQGFYYNTSTTATPTWVYLFGASLNHWSLAGNAGSTAGSNFLGTTDAVDLVVKTNNTERLRVLSGGNVGIGTTTPSQQFEITRNFRLPNSTATTGIIYSGGSRYIHNYGTNNFFAGANAGNLTTLTGTDNTGIGSGTLASGADGSGNTAIGAFALRANTAGDDNSAIGYVALANNTTGFRNTAIGAYALRANTTGKENDALGFSALMSNTTGDRNVAIGFIALNANTTGYGNVAVGPYALADHRKQDRNVAIGLAALRYDTTGVDNTSIGYYSLYNNKNGSYNVALGKFAGLNATGSYNVFLGHSAGENETGSNKLYIANSGTSSPLIYGDFSTNLLRVNGTLNVNSAYSLPTTDGASGQILTTNGAGTLSWGSNGADNLGSHTATQNIRLNNQYLSNDGGNEGIRIDNTGNIGIGTTAPNEQLEITRNFRLPNSTATTGIIYSGGSRYIHNYGGTSNFFAGVDAGNLTTSAGFENTGIGYGTLAKITTGFGNAGIGAYALSSTTTGEDNNAMGYYALGANTTGIRNVGIGYIALSANTTGDGNVAVGPYALANHRKNDGNVAIGSAALRFDTTGVENTSIGNNAMYNNQNGSRNVALGQSAGYNSIGSYNVFLGYSAGSNETSSNKLYIDNSNTSSPLLYGDFSTNLLRVNGTLNVNSAYSLPTTDGASGQILTTNGAGTLSWGSNGADNLGSHTATQNIRLNNQYLSNDGGNEGIRIDNTGNIGIGTASPTKARVEINGAQNATMAYGFLNSAGAVGTNGSATNAYSLYASSRIAATEFNAFSDARIKNIRGVSNSTQDLQTLMNLRVTDYTFKDTIAKGVGLSKKVIAQQVAQVYPQAVSTLTDIVPDIYTLAELKAGRIELANTLKAGEKVKLIFAGHETITEVVTADATGFRVNLPGSGKVFVYGREVKDFHTVDYEALGTLNISATQELMKIITKQHEIIQSLKAENEVVKTENKAAKNRLSAVEAEVQQIKEMIGIQATSK